MLDSQWPLGYFLTWKNYNHKLDKVLSNGLKDTNGNSHNFPLKINTSIWVHSVYISKYLFYLATHTRGTPAILNDELHMSIHMFIVAFDAVAIRFLGRLLLHCTWLWISMIDDSCCFSSAGPVLKAWRTYSCRLLGKKERQKVMVRCFCSPTLNCNLSKSVFACPYFILDISHPPAFPLLPLSPQSSCPCLFHGMQCLQKHPWPVESWFIKTHTKKYFTYRSI